MGSASRFVVFVTALAFALQCYLVQTHIHGMLQSEVVKVAAAPSPAPGKVPFDHSRADCPVCQAVAHAGAFLAPAVLATFAFGWAEHVTLFVTPRAATDAGTHYWQSRAPPRR